MCLPPTFLLWVNCTGFPGGIDAIMPLARTRGSPLTMDPTAAIAGLMHTEIKTKVSVYIPNRLWSAGKKFNQHQGRNFGLKSGGTNSEGERGAHIWWVPSRKGRRMVWNSEWRGSALSSSDSGVRESVVSDPAGSGAEPRPEMVLL